MNSKKVTLARASLLGAKLVSLLVEMFITVHKNVRKNSDLKQSELLREMLSNSHPENVFSNDLP